MIVLSRYSKPLYNSNRNTLEEKIEGVRETGNGEHQEQELLKQLQKVCINSMRLKQELQGQHGSVPDICI